MKELPPGSLESRLVELRRRIAERAPFLFGHRVPYSIEGTFEDRVLVKAEGRLQVVLLEGNRADRVYDLLDPVAVAERMLHEGTAEARRALEEGRPMPADHVVPSKTFLDTAPLQFARSRYAELLGFCGEHRAAFRRPEVEAEVGYLRFLSEDVARGPAVAYCDHVRAKAEAVYRRVSAREPTPPTYTIPGMTEAVRQLPKALAELVKGPPYHYRAPLPEVVDLAGALAIRVYESEILAYAAKSAPALRSP